MKKTAAVILLFIGIASNVFSQKEQISVVERPLTNESNSNYVTNRQPLLPEHFIKLPVGK